MEEPPARHREQNGGAKPQISCCARSGRPSAYHGDTIWLAHSLHAVVGTGTVQLKLSFTASLTFSLGPSSFTLPSRKLHLLTPGIHRQQVNTRQYIITLLPGRFTLSVDEANQLSSSEVPVGSTFFAAVDRAQAIRDDYRVLMAGEDSLSRIESWVCLFCSIQSVLMCAFARLDIMAVTSAHLEKQAINCCDGVASSSAVWDAAHFSKFSMNSVNPTRTPPPLAPRAPIVRRTSFSSSLTAY